MVDYFVYGALTYRPLLGVVLGTSGASVSPTMDDLPGYGARETGFGCFASLEIDAGQTVAGLCLQGLTLEGRARLDFFRAACGFVVQNLSLASGHTGAVAIATGGATGQDWSLERFSAKWADMALVAVAELMSHYGQKRPEQIVWLLNSFFTRAQSRLHAAMGRNNKDWFGGDVEVLRNRRLHSRFFALDQVSLRHATFSGVMSEAIERTVFVAADAALVLPYDPVRDRVLLVEQIRMGPLGRGDPALWLLEPVAGLIDPGETPETTAYREAGEEAGVELTALEPVAEGYSSPGCTTDFQFLYVGLCDLPDGGAGRGGLAAEGEDIRTHLFDFGKLLEMADDRRLSVAPLTLMVHWLARHRARLRSV